MQEKAFLGNTIGLFPPKTSKKRQKITILNQKTSYRVVEELLQFFVGVIDA